MGEFFGRKWCFFVQFLMAAKAKGSFTITTKKGTVTDVGKNYCRKTQRADGYGYLHGFAPVGGGHSSSGEIRGVP
jgi:hypothetical protein